MLNCHGKSKNVCSYLQLIVSKPVIEAAISETEVALLPCFKTNLSLSQSINQFSPFLFEMALSILKELLEGYVQSLFDEVISCCQLSNVSTLHAIMLC